MSLATRLQLGMDGKPYFLQGGKLLKLSVSASASVGRFAHDGNQSLAPTGQNIKVAVGGTVSDKTHDVRAFAMVNDKLFVTLDGDGQLELHDNGKPARALPREGLDGEIRSLALDNQQNLHALSENGTLYRLPRQDWRVARAARRTRVGRSNVENRHRSGTAEFIRAHVFKPTLETPRR